MNTVVGGDDASTKNQNYVVSEALATVVMKRTISWDITLCTPVNFSYHFERTRQHISA
jgi:hypothetical protein